METINFVCIDDVETIIGTEKCEKALLKLINGIEKNNGKALLAITETEESAKFVNSDLLNKISISYNQPIFPLNNIQKLEALYLRANNRGISVDGRVAKFLVRNCENNLSGLFSYLDKLDKASLQKQRKLTIPFVKDVLNL